RDPCGGGIQGFFERKFQSDVAEKAIFVIVRRPTHVAVLPGELSIVDIASREKFLGSTFEGLFESGCIGNYLECGARLSLRLRNAIELALLIVAAADHRANFSTLG